MRKLGATGRKWLKAFHIAFSGVWMGITTAALLLNLNVGSAASSVELNAYLGSAKLVADLIPITSLGTIITGLLISWLTAWGFFKYWSVVFQLVAAILVILVAQIWLDPAGVTLRTLAEAEGLLALDSANFSQAFQQVVVSAGINVAILVATALIASVKPWGKTRKSMT